ncbi:MULTISPECIES: MarR family winged helix-turn-helix transcriptional regulator [unclassified Streptomyces]|uniref:MarR family winged helix-turn-helix transcriptional regulator n=1 Tax=unclassified Streptomyces TaxID=2593676 RepID=UPI0038124785|nr:MarR family winged helix-turn-helix transcriptional regulator [Streptomyces sp. NBC_01176]
MTRNRNGYVPADARSAPVAPTSTLGYHMKRAEQAIVTRKAHGVRDLDITEAQCKVLGYLTGGVAKSCTQLSKEALVTSQTMTGIVKNLEAKGLVERHASPDHGRVMLVSLTPAGEERAAAAKSFSQRVEHGLREAMTEEDYTRLVGLLDRVAALAPQVDARAER